MENYREFFEANEDQYATYSTDSGWVTKERLVKIKKAYDKFVKLAIIDVNGYELYNECCNYFSLNDKGDVLKIV